MMAKKSKPAPKKRGKQSAVEARDKALEALRATLNADVPKTVKGMKKVAAASGDLLRRWDELECGLAATAEAGRVVNEQVAVLEHLLASDEEFGDFGELTDREMNLVRCGFRMGSMETYLALARSTHAGRGTGLRNGNNKKAAAAVKRDAAIKSFYESAAGASGDRMAATMREFGVKKTTVYQALNRVV